MKQLNRHILKLLMLFVGLFAISNVGWANYYISGYCNIMSQTNIHNWTMPARELTQAADGYYYFWISGEFAISTKGDNWDNFNDNRGKGWMGTFYWTGNENHVNNDWGQNSKYHVRMSSDGNTYADQSDAFSYDYYLKYWGGGENKNQEDYIKLTNGSRVTIDASKIGNSTGIGITVVPQGTSINDVKNGGKQVSWFHFQNSASATDNQNTSYTLVRDGLGKNLPMPDVYNGVFAVTLTTSASSGNPALPSSLRIEIPSKKNSIYFFSNQGVRFDEEITKDWGVAYEVTLDANGEGSYSPIEVDDDHYLLFSDTNVLENGQLNWNRAFRPNSTSSNESVNPNVTTTAYSGKGGDKSFKMPGGTYRLEVEGYNQTDGNITFKLVPLQLISNNPELAGKYFLVGHQINNNTPSPAWELVKDGSTYKLDNFAMRYSNDIGVVYFNANGDPTYIACNVNNMPAKEIGGEWKLGYYSSVGWSYSASFTPNNASNPTSGTLTLNNGSSFNVNTNMLPYIGVLGYNFIQKNQVNTPMTGKNTGSGWEQAYIEYDEDGYPILKNDGSAYYNTVWPPKNNILMQANIGNDKLNVSSKDLTLIPVGTQSGTDWASDLAGDEYANLRTELDGNSTEYTRYIVRNVWMQGEFKLWTGWAGIPASWGANWDTHFYWGPKQSDGIEFFDTDTKANGIRQVDFNTVYSTSNLNYSGGGTHNNANLNFGTLRKNNSYSRAYYKTMELFIPKDDNSGDVYNFLGSKLYLTQAPGGAQIDAIGRQAGEERKAYYAPSLTYVPQGYHVSSYRVTRYAFEAAADSEHFDTELDPCDKERKKVSYNNALVIGESTNLGSSIKTEQAFADRFRNDADGYTLDAGNYEAGRYIFRLEVTFTNDDDATKTMTADEWSPYIEFIGDFKIGLEAYQLVELPKTDNPFSGYTHITYDEENNYKLVSYDGSTVSKYEDIPEDTEESVITDIYNNTGKWTNKVLLASQVPAQYYNTGRKRQIEGFYINGTNNDANALKRVGTDYLKVVDQTTNLNNKEYSAQFDAKFVIDESGEYKTLQDAINKQDNITATTTYTPFLPSPRVKKAKVELIYWDNDENPVENATPKTFKFQTSSGNTFEIESARYQSVREVVEIDLPNVEENLAATANSKFSYYFELDGDEKITEPITLLEDGTLDSNTVIPSTLFSKDNGGICDFKDVKYTTTYSNIYDRGWLSYDPTNENPGRITSIAITDDAPLTEEQKGLDQGNAKVEIRNLRTDYEDEGGDNLILTYDVYIEMIGQNDNSLKHEDKDDVPNDGLLHGDTNNGQYDYFFLGLYNTKQNGELVSESYAENARKAEFVAKVEDLHPNAGGYDDNGPGYTMTIKKSLGIFNGGWNDLIRLHDQEREYIRGLELRVSYLYPFDATDKSGLNSIKARSGSKLTGEVLKSKATSWSLDTDAVMDPGIATGIEGIGDNAGSIRAGHGFIEVEGQSVAIYNASGICIATAEGRYDVAPGVYVVRLNGATSKVLVK